MRSYAKVVVRLVVFGMLFFAGVSCLYAQDVQEKVKTAMQMLEAKTSALGAAKLEGGTLSFGDTDMNGNYDVVDEVSDNNGCTATIFAASGDGFKRIATNVIKDGNRAVGTMLDPNGAAIKKIKVGEAFYGEVDILGDKYQAGYEPLKSTSGAIIGVLYVGYKE